MEKERKLGMMFNSLAEELNITKTMLDKAVTAYSALGDHIKSANEEWDIVVYPQGSFELGTVVKPINEYEQYDVDLVVVVNNPDFSAEDLRSNIKELLKSHGRYEGKIQDKKPCVRIQYADSSQFHMDVASAMNMNDAYAVGTDIKIARFDGEQEYYYDPSNPKGYIEWFKTVMKYEDILIEKRAFSHKAETEVEKLELSKLRTPLQKAIQILKRHRDKYFSDKYNSDDRPSSIVITTLCGLAYANLSNVSDEKSNVYTIIKCLIGTMSNYIEYENVIGWKLLNPSRADENFLNKWNSNNLLKVAYDEWINQARMDILINPEKFIDSDVDKLKEGIYHSFGENIGKAALQRYGEQFGNLKEEGNLKFDLNTVSITTKPEANDYKEHTYYGGQYHE